MPVDPSADVPFGSLRLLLSPLKKKKTLSFMIGPPRRPPYCVCSNSPTFVFVGPLPTNDGSRFVPNTEPSHLFVPERVTAFTPPPVKPLWRTSYGETTSWVS